MITLAITDAVVREYSGQWIVQHPSNDAILAYASTEAEALLLRDALNDLGQQLAARARRTITVA